MQDSARRPLDLERAGPVPHHGRELERGRKRPRPRQRARQVRRTRMGVPRAVQPEADAARRHDARPLPYERRSRLPQTGADAGPGGRAHLVRRGGVLQAVRPVAGVHKVFGSSHRAAGHPRGGRHGAAEEGPPPGGAARPALRLLRAGDHLRDGPDWDPAPVGGGHAQHLRRGSRRSGARPRRTRRLSGGVFPLRGAPGAAAWFLDPSQGQEGELGRV
mmetsp:Transcript_28809/g.64393  ORF Transcript_28809/g.64393 Transcript_28809/m.64393 type:complete len:218 (+) Transcript_28809:2550-3203(+)